MKSTFICFSLACGLALGAGELTLVVSESGQAAGSVAERRAVAMGSKLERFETMKGRVYQDVMITEINDGGISFSHADGVVRLRFDDLSPEQSRYFGINEATAAEFYRREREAMVAYEKQVEEREAARKKAAEQEALARFIAAEEAAEEAETVVVRSIPALPEVKRVDSINFSGRRYSSHGYSYGYPSYYHSGFYPRYRSSGGYYFGRSGGHCGYRTPGFVIRW